MMPSCVPATEIDESGAELDCKDIDLYLDNKKVLGLAEMMNYVGVINGDKMCFQNCHLAGSPQEN